MKCPNCQKELESLMKARPGLAPELEHVVFQALTKKAADRYRTMEELREDLAAIAEGLKPLKAKPRPAAVKLAVLPFANLTGDPEQEYLSDGLTQEMITLLGRLHPENLGVIARTSVMRYKKTDTPIDQIGRELGVEYVLEGSARREGSRVRVSADLIQVRDQTQLWGDVFEREIAGILALQNDVARNIAKALAFKLLPSERALLAKARPVIPEAHEAYVKGMSHWYKLTPPDLDTARQYFKSALKEDPDYALAHVGLALVWTGYQQMGLLPPSEATPHLKAAAQKALELDDTLPEVHFTWAAIHTWVDWDYEAGKKAFIRAIDLNPNYALARIYYSQWLAILGRSDEAFAQAEKALELDPLNSLVQGIYANTLAFARRYDQAIVHARNALRTSPHDPIGHQILWEMFHSKGQYEEAFPEAKAYFTGLGLTQVAEAMDSGYDQGGYPGAIRTAAEAMAAFSREMYVSPWWISIVYSFAGEKRQALDWMEKACEMKDPNMPYIYTPGFNILHGEPRYQDMLRKMNLPPVKKEMAF
jgi:adenylate cyclase